MERDFDLKNIGKKMPYTVPEGFFDALEQNVLAATTDRNKQEKPAAKRRTMFKTMLAAAAGLALVLVFSIYSKVNNKENSQETSFTEVEQAFCSLSQTHQDYHIEAYQDDIFLQNAVAEESQWQ